MGPTQSSDASPGNEAAPSRSASPPEEGWVRIVCISDTHGKHADLDDVPDGDVLIHAGDYTTFGKEVHARASNEWLGTLPHPHKLVVNGNHEANAPWLLYAAEILSNATLLAPVAARRASSIFSTHRELLVVGDGARRGGGAHMR